MKTPKKLCALLAVAALGLGVATGRAADEAAAPANPPAENQSNLQKLPPRLERRMKFLDEHLKLSAEQKEKIATIWTKANQEMRDAQQGLGTATRRARKEKYREVMQDVRSQVRGLLTPEQQKEFDALPPETGRRAKPASSEI